MSSRLFWGAVVLVCFSASANAGILEICKFDDPSGSLGFSIYNFTLTNGVGRPVNTDLGAVIQVPVGYCSDNILLPNGIDPLPDGDYTITEQADPTSTLEGVTTNPGYALLGVNLSTDSAIVLTSGAADPTNTTYWVTANFTNTPVAVPEPGTAWLLGLGMTVWALRGNLAKRPYHAALRNATKSAVRRAIG